MDKTDLIGSRELVRHAMEMKPPQKPPVIQCFHLHKAYENGCAPLRDASLEIRRGEMVILLGPDGAGKTTFLRCLLGLESPDQGCISIDGVDLQSRSSKEIAYLRRRMGMVFQEDRLIESWSVSRNVAMPMDAAGRSRLFIRERIPRILHFAGLGSKAGNLCGQLSVSERRRAAIARAIAGDPSVLLADEPTGGLDGQSGQETVELIEEVHLRGITVIVATHDPSLSSRFSQSRVVLLAQGRFLDRTPLRDFADPCAMSTPDAGNAF